LKKHIGRRKRIANARNTKKMGEFWGKIFLAAFDIAKDLERPAYGYYSKPPDHETAHNLRTTTNSIMEGLARG